MPLASGAAAVPSAARCCLYLSVATTLASDFASARRFKPLTASTHTSLGTGVGVAAGVGVSAGVGDDSGVGVNVGGGRVGMAVGSITASEVAVSVGVGAGPA